MLQPTEHLIAWSRPARLLPASRSGHDAFSAYCVKSSTQRKVQVCPTPHPPDATTLDEHFRAKQGLSLARESKERGSPKHDRPHADLGDWTNCEDGRRCKEGLGDGPRLQASPPTGKKQPYGARPYAGRSPRQSDSKRRGETQEEQQDRRGPTAVPKERDVRKRDSSVGIGESKLDSAPRRGIGGSATVAHRAGKESDGTGRKPMWRYAAGDEESTQFEGGSDSDAVVSETRGRRGEQGGALRAGEGDRNRQDSEEESVRAAAQSFVGSVLDELSSAESLSRMSLSLK